MVASAFSNRRRPHVGRRFPTPCGLPDVPTTIAELTPSAAGTVFTLPRPIRHATTSVISTLSTAPKHPWVDAGLVIEAPGPEERLERNIPLRGSTRHGCNSRSCWNWAFSALSSRYDD